MIKREDIQYRVDRSTATGENDGWAIFLIYIDARTASRELDEKYSGKWSFKWDLVENQIWAVKGILEVIKDTERFTYQDVGYPNDFKKTQKPDETQWLKDAVSDALKRCAIQAGIGRELYDAPFLYTTEIEAKKNQAGRWNFKKLTPMGEKMIEGKIDEWYSKLSKELKNGN